jgi:hypothetical protein
MFFAGVIQLVECQIPDLDVAGSSPVTRLANDIVRPSSKHFIEKQIEYFGLVAKRK